MKPDDEAKAKDIGKRIRQLREALGLSQRQLAEPGVCYAYISRIESGTRLPSVKVLRKLAPKLGVSVEYLETGEEAPVTLESRSLEELFQEIKKRISRLDILDEKTSIEIREYAERCAERGDAKALVELVNRLIERLEGLQDERYREALAATMTFS